MAACQPTTKGSERNGTPKKLRGWPDEPEKVGWNVSFVGTLRRASRRGPAQQNSKQKQENKTHKKNGYKSAPGSARLPTSKKDVLQVDDIVLKLYYSFLNSLD